MSGLPSTIEQARNEAFSPMIPYNSENKPRGLYFSKALFEGLIFGGAYIWRSLSMEGNSRYKINWASVIVGSKFTVFALFYFVFEGNFPSTSPQGAYIWRGDLHLSGCVLCTSFFSQKLIFNSLPTSFFNPFSPMVIVRGIASKKPFTKPFSAIERQG